MPKERQYIWKSESAAHAIVTLNFIWILQNESIWNSQISREPNRWSACILKDTKKGENMFFEVWYNHELKFD